MNACGLARETFPDMDRGALKARMKELDEGQWSSDAVRDAISSIQAAMVAATMVATTPAITGGSC